MHNAHRVPSRAPTIPCRAGCMFVTEPTLGRMMEKAELEVYVDAWQPCEFVSEAVDTQLRYQLVILTTGQALQIIRRRSCGVQAFRCLARRFNPRIQARSLAKLQEIVHFHCGQDPAVVTDRLSSRIVRHTHEMVQNRVFCTCSHPFFFEPDDAAERPPDRDFGFSPRHNATHQHHSTSANLHNQQQAQKQTTTPLPIPQQQQQLSTTSNKCTITRSCIDASASVQKKAKGSSNNSCNKKKCHMASKSMETPSQRQATPGPQSPPSGPEQQKRTRVTPRPRWSMNNNNNNRDDDNNGKNSNNSCNLQAWGNEDDNDTHSGHNYNVPSGSAVQTCYTDSPPATLTATLNAIGTNNSNLANHKAPTTAKTAPATAQQTQ